jgi:hypothetical protein
MFSGGVPPAWALILQCAEEWGVTPWTIEDGPAIWFERWKFYRAKAQMAEIAKHGKP